MANHVPTRASTTSTPPPLPLTAAASDPAMPCWQHLLPEVRQPVVALLTRMLQQHLPAANATAAREVADECR